MKNNKKRKNGGSKSDTDKWDKLYLSILELRKSQKKTDEQIKELKESQAKTDEQMKKTDEQMKKTDERINRTNEHIGELTDSQGLFWESLSLEGIKKFLRDEGYEIKGVLRHVEKRTKSGEMGEFDIVFEAEKDNEKEIFIAEVKSTASVGKINKFVKSLKKIFGYFPEYENRKIWGLFASGRYGNGTDVYAIRKGLIAFGVSGDVLVVLNKRIQMKPFKSNYKQTK